MCWAQKDGAVTAGFPAGSPNRKHAVLRVMCVLLTSPSFSVCSLKCVQEHSFWIQHQAPALGLPQLEMIFLKTPGSVGGMPGAHLQSSCPDPSSPPSPPVAPASSCAGWVPSDLYAFLGSTEAPAQVMAVGHNHLPRQLCSACPSLPASRPHQT